jgi:CAAX protease family protein
VNVRFRAGDPRVRVRAMSLDPRRRSAALTVFLAVAYALGWFVQLQVGQAAAGRPAAELLPILAASAPALALPPALATWLARRSVERLGFEDAGLRLPAGRWLAAGWLLAPLLTLATVAASLPFNALDMGLAPLRAALAQAAAGAPPPSPAAALGVQAVAMLVLYPLFAFGQELGWRGYLLPRLVAELGAWRGVLLHGLAWGAWYTPLIAIGGYGYPGHPALGVALFTAFGALLGVVLAWLTFASGSIVPATLVHGGLMAAAGLPPALLVGLDPAVSGMPWSPVGLAVLGLLVAGLALSGALGRALARGPAALGRGPLSPAAPAPPPRP